MSLLSTTCHYIRSDIFFFKLDIFNVVERQVFLKKNLLNIHRNQLAEP